MTLIASGVSNEVDFSARTLFEFLGIADQERIHTQTLAWLLTKDASPLLPEEKVRLLRALGVECDEKSVARMRVSTEVKSIDLVVFDSEGGLELLLENKLKSRQSKAQMEDYDKAVKSVADALGVLEGTPKRAFLTLSREVSTAGWSGIDYSAVRDALISSSVNKDVRDYARLLGQLVVARDRVTANPKNYPEIWAHVAASQESRAKSELKGASPEAKFVIRNRLERIFLETLLRDMASNYPSAYVDVGSYGQPLVQVKFFLVNIAEKWYRAGVQYQRGTLKLNIAHLDYENSDLGGSLAFFDDVLGIHGNKGTTRDYRSWSLGRAPELDVRSLPLKGCQEALQRRFKDARHRWEKVLQSKNHNILGFKEWSIDEERSHFQKFEKAGDSQALPSPAPDKRAVARARKSGSFATEPSPPV